MNKQFLLASEPATNAASREESGSDPVSPGAVPPKNAAYTVPDEHGCTLPEVCWTFLRQIAQPGGGPDGEIIWKVPSNHRARLPGPGPFIVSLVERGYLRLHDDATGFHLTEAGRVLLTLYPQSGKPVLTPSGMGKKGRGKKKTLTPAQRADQRARLNSVRSRRHLPKHAANDDSAALPVKA